MVKVISLSEEAYSKLKSMKGEKSFSELVIGLASERKPRKSLIDLASALKDSAEEWEGIKKKVYDDRDRFNIRKVKL